MVGEVSLASSSSSSHRKIISLSGWPERGVVPPLPARNAGSRKPSDLLDGTLRGQCQIADGCCEKARRLAAGHHSVVEREA